MNKTIQLFGGNLSRLTIAVQGFRLKYGKWPKEVHMNGLALIGIATSHLTPLGFFLLQSKLKLEAFADAEKYDFIAFGNEGESYSYTDDHDRFGDEAQKTDDVFLWLGLDSE